MSAVRRAHLEARVQPETTHAHRYQDSEPHGNAEGDTLGNPYYYAYRYTYGYHAASAATWRRCALTGGGDAPNTHREPCAVPYALCGACAACDCDCAASAADVGDPEGIAARWVLTAGANATSMVVEEG